MDHLPKGQSALNWTDLDPGFPRSLVPSGGSNVRHMIFDPRKKELWFGTDKNTIGRAKVT